MAIDLSACKTVHEVLVELLDVSVDIDYCAQSLGLSDYCPARDHCGYDCSSCWRSWLDKEVLTNGNA